MKAARRVDDYSTAVRIFEGLKQKVENESQYEQYLVELKGIKEELGTCLSSKQQVAHNMLTVTLYSQALLPRRSCTDVKSILPSSPHTHALL